HAVARPPPAPPFTHRLRAPGLCPSPDTPHRSKSNGTSAISELGALSLHDALPIFEAGNHAAVETALKKALAWVEHDWLATPGEIDRKSTRLNSSHGSISYAVFWLKK